MGNRSPWADALLSLNNSWSKKETAARLLVIHADFITDERAIRLGCVQTKLHVLICFKHKGSHCKSQFTPL